MIPLTLRRCMAADCLISPEPYTIFNRRDSSYAPLKGWQIFVDLPAPKKAQVRQRPRSHADYAFSRAIFCRSSRCANLLALQY